MKIELPETVEQAVLVLRKACNAHDAVRQAEQEVEEFAAKMGLMATRYGERASAVARIQEFISIGILKAVAESAGK